MRVFTGHAHTNYTVSYLNMTEYNVGAIGGNLWWTGYFVNGNSVCTDGSPGGYRVLDTSGKELKTYYKCIGFDNGYQFRCYDLNNCHITASVIRAFIQEPCGYRHLACQWIRIRQFRLQFRRHSQNPEQSTDQCVCLRHKLESGGFGRREAA